MRTGFLIFGLVCLLAAVLLLARHNQRTLTAGLPPRIVCATQEEARAAAGPTAIAVLGTGSMAPYIPAAAPGRDPLATVVAYLVPDANLVFTDIRPGRIVVYKPDWSPIYAVAHGAASQDAAGWIMSGLHNRDYEARTRVNTDNFLAIVASVYVWPQ